MQLLAPLHARRFRLASAFVPLALVACGSSGDDGGAPPAEYWVAIESAGPSVTSAEIELSGFASCDACPSDDVAFGGCPPVHGPFTSAIEIQWGNHTTGATGSAFHQISGSCACLFSTCWVSYAHRWLASVPLELGPNVIEVDAFGPLELPGSATITITRTPPAPLGLTARAGVAEIELAWEGRPRSRWTRPAPRTSATSRMASAGGSYATRLARAATGKSCAWRRRPIRTPLWPSI